MDEIDEELLRLLCAKIGMLMEDYSALALTLGGQSDETREAAVHKLADASTKIATLAAAAQSINE